MSSPPLATPAEPSPIDAATAAYEHTRRHLLPFNLERWLALGFVAFLDQCGRGGISGSFPGNLGSPGVPGDGDAGGGGGLPEIGAWLGENVLLVVAIAAAAIALIFALTALILWINSRATFVYIENVAHGRTDIARPWRDHAERAWSYFGWRFAVMMGVFVGLVVLVGIAIAAVVAFQENGYAIAAVLLVVVPLLILMVVAAALLSVALRDFVAPIQMAAGVTCGEGLRRVSALVRAHPMAFFLYVMLKVVFGIAQGIVIFIAACFTCCCILIPVVTQTFLQPLFYFERAWPLYLLREMGYDLVSGATAAASVPEPPPLLPPPGGLA